MGIGTGAAAASLHLFRNNGTVAPLDVATVALASAQALKETVDAQHARIVAQEATITAQNAQIAALEAQMAIMQESIQRLDSMAHTHAYLPAVANDQ